MTWVDGRPLPAHDDVQVSQRGGEAPDSLVETVNLPGLHYNDGAIYSPPIGHPRLATCLAWARCEDDQAHRWPLDRPRSRRAGKDWHVDITVACGEVAAHAFGRDPAPFKAEQTFNRERDVLAFVPGQVARAPLLSGHWLRCI